MFHQVEYLWPPCSFLEPNGPSYLVEGAGSFLTMLPVGINANGKALTVMGVSIAQAYAIILVILIIDPCDNDY
jgi:hypothetical protein